MLVKMSSAGTRGLSILGMPREQNQNTCTLFEFLQGRRFLEARRLECNGFEV
jgi:hypothetical protein